MHQTKDYLLAHVVVGDAIDHRLGYWIRWTNAML